MNKNKILEPLNKQQKEAVLYSKGPLAIIAGAGTGKTRTITRKIAYLIASGIKPETIAAVTFSNKAANEMRERVHKLMGKESRGVLMSTYHSFCLRILKKNHEKAGLKPRFNILDELDQIQILRPIYKKYGVSSKTHNFKEVLSFISKHKITRVSVEDLEKNASSDVQKIKIIMYREYEIERKRIFSLDFDDLLIYTYILFQEHPEIPRSLSKVYKYILVDEFQDTSWIQYDIIKQVAQHGNITIVGDPDQTIYSWRQADVEILNNFKKYFKKAKVIKLVQNYRSTQTILNAANSLIQYNNARDDKKLFSNKPNGDQIDFYYAFSEDSESKWIVGKINELKKQKNQLKDIAILYRANYQSQAIERVLIKENINYVIFGGVKFYHRHEIKDIVAFLKVINDGDESALIRVINTPSRKIGETTLKKLVDFSKTKTTTLFDTIVNNFNNLPISLKQKQSLALFINSIRKYRASLSSNSISKVIEKFLLEINYRSIWKSSEDQARFENIDQFINSIKYWEDKHPDKTIHDFLEEISLFVDGIDPKSESKDYISLMTVHAAKGLEYKNIFLIGFSEGVFPSARALDSDDDSGLEEERRLAYVAITRAMDKLFLSHSRGYAIDHKTEKKPSRFIGELGINIEEHTSVFIAPKKFDEVIKKSSKGLNIGDKILHIKFGIGVIVSEDGDLVDISFKDPYGIKTLMKNHKSIERIT